jgi:tripartite-type tricarboxylate transporter receptor subunit TctC
MSMRYAGWCVALLAGFSSTAAFAQVRYPDRAVRIIVPTSPGGIIDFTTRVVSPKLGELMGQTIVIENRPGASNNIGAELVARAAPDGYTLLAITGTLVVNPSLYAKMTFSPEKDLAPVTLLTSVPYVMVVHPSLPVKSIKDLVALARAKPDAINYASGGNGTNLHMAVAMMSSMAGIRVTHVPYKGGGPALAAVIAGETSLTAASLAVTQPQINARRIRALAITSEQRSQLLPEVPTMSESGLPGYAFSAWVGYLAPAGTSPDIVTAVNGHFVKVVRLPEVAARLAADGTQIVASTPAQFGAFIRTEIPRWAKIVRESGIQPE